MRLRIGHVRHALIVAPHPDDEVIGAAALIVRLRQRGVQVRVAIISDGAASHPGSLRWPARRLVRQRQRESRRALLRLGLAAADVTFLDLPDGALAFTKRCAPRIARLVATCRALDLVVAPDDDDAHPDHRAVAHALAHATRATRRLDYRVWPPARRGDRRGTSVTMPGGCAAKRSLIRVHRSQLGAIRDDPAGFAIARHELDAFAHPVEYFTEGRR